MKYRKKPVIVEAMRLPDVFDIDGRLAFEEWLTKNGRVCRYVGDGLDVPTLEGVMRANKGDWIIRGVKGEIYPCKPDIFEATYEAAMTHEQQIKAVAEAIGEALFITHGFASSHPMREAAQAAIATINEILGEKK